MSKEKWCYELDATADIWRGGIFDSREEAIEEANREAIYDNFDKFKIGKCVEVFNYGIDTDDVLERINANLYDDVGEVAEDYLLDVTKEHQEELEEQLNEVFFKWQEKHNYKPNFYTIEDEEIIAIKKQ